MKKLVALMLVLGLATAANATISLSLNGSPAPDEYTMNQDTVVKIDITSDLDNMPYGAWIGLDPAEGLGEWQGSWTIYPIAGNTAGAQLPGETGYPGWCFAEAKTSDPDNAPITAGKHFEIDYHCTGLGDVAIILQDFQLVEVDRIVIHQIPEPVSMLLLGLGGLLLRRRK